MIRLGNGDYMEYLSAYYRTKEGECLPLFLQQYLCKGKPILFSCVCRDGNAEDLALMEDLLAWCRTYPWESHRGGACRRIVKAAEALGERIGKGKERVKRGETDFPVAGMLCIEDYCYTFAGPDTGLYLVDAMFGIRKAIPLRMGAIPLRIGAVERIKPESGILITSEKLSTEVLQQIPGMWREDPDLFVTALSDAVTAFSGRGFGAAFLHIKP